LQLKDYKSSIETPQSDCSDDDNLDTKGLRLHLAEDNQDAQAEAEFQDIGKLIQMMEILIFAWDRSTGKRRIMTNL
jgi:hypothetical protein